MADHNWNFVIAAYAVTWVVILGYWYRVTSAARRARGDFERTVRNHPEDFS